MDLANETVICIMNMVGWPLTSLEEALA
jgi:hypothetical protein